MHDPQRRPDAMNAPSGDTSRSGRRRPAPWRTLFALLVAALAAGAVVAVVVFDRPEDGSIVSGFEPAEGETLFPRLAGNAERIGEIEIEGRDGVTRLRREDSRWRVEGMGAYPADGEAVDALLRRVAGLRTIAVSTSGDPRHADYGVANPGPKAGSGVRIALRDNRDGEGAVLIVGHAVSSPQAGESRNTFVRRDDDPRVWIVDRALAPNPAPLEWVEHEIVDLPRGDVARVTVRTPEGATIEARRSADGQLNLAGGPLDDEALDGPWVLDRLASALESVRFEDVRPAGEAGRPDETWRYTAHTSDGLVYEARIWFEPDTGAPLATFAAAPDPRADDRPELRGRAERFNARHDGWAYRVTTYTANLLTVAPADLR